MHWCVRLPNALPSGGFILFMYCCRVERGEQIMEEQVGRSVGVLCSVLWRVGHDA
jgi:hypothetical protein